MSKAVLSIRLETMPNDNLSNAQVVYVYSYQKSKFQKKLKIKIQR